MKKQPDLFVVDELLLEYKLGNLSRAEVWERLEEDQGLDPLDIEIAIAETDATSIFTLEERKQDERLGEVIRLEVEESADDYQ